MAQPRIGDVWGAILADALDGKPAQEIVERDDGFVMAFDARYLLAPFKKWDDADERRAMRLVRGRVLDVGCGGGRAKQSSIRVAIFPKREAIEENPP
jgi:hypothetical protein